MTTSNKEIRSKQVSSKIKYHPLGRHSGPKSVLDLRLGNLNSSHSAVFFISIKTVTCRQAKMEEISVETFMKYVSLLTKSVEQKISKALPEQIVLVFDSRECQQTLYVRVFPLYSS